jgi:hypothetical protein
MLPNKLSTVWKQLDLTKNSQGHKEYRYRYDIVRRLQLWRETGDDKIHMSTMAVIQ